MIILSMHAERMLAQAALRKGARGYVLKEAIKSELAKAVRAVNGGETYVSAALA